MEREVRYCTTEDGVRIAYCAEGEGPPLLMTPFFNESFSLHHLVPEVDRLLQPLRSNRRVILYDPRGTGLSERDAPIDAQSGDLDLQAVVRASCTEPVAIWAYFTYVFAAVRFAVQSPDAVERLVLCSAMPVQSSVFPVEIVRSFIELVRTNWPLAAQTFGDMSTRQADPSAGLRWGKLYLESSRSDAMMRNFEASLAANEDIRDELTKLTVPTLVMHRIGDLNVPLEIGQQVAALIPNALFAPVEGVMTHPALGDQEPVLRAALPFLTPTADRQSTLYEHTKPSAFRTVLFTDLVGHTEMMSRLGDERGRAVLREHESITREVLKQHAGTEVKTMGDGFMASFASVAKAVECAVALQQAFDARNHADEANRGVGASHDSPLRASEPRQSPVEPLNVRVGLNAGEPIEEDGDLFGATVILASRIAAKAEAGEILVADTVRGLCSGKGFLFADRGEFVAKGFEDPVRIYEVNWQA